MAEDVGTDVDRAAGTTGLPAPQPNGGSSPPRAPRSSLLVGLVRTARPKQWAKNVLVFAAPGAAGVLTHGSALADTLIAFACFCLAASGTYFLNDAGDAEADRLHPKKRARPVAAGVVSIRLARVIGVLLIAGGVGLGFATGSWKLSVVVAIYVAVTTSYTIWLKHVPVVDLAAVASGFVLRAIAGAAATGVPISDWFFIVTSFGSLFIVAGKRHAEAREMGGGGSDFRATLAAYSSEYLNHVRAVASGVAMVAYCLWAFEKSHHHSGVPWFELSILPFVLAVLRYELVVEAGGGGAPEDVVMGDRPLQIMGLVWIAVVGISIYLG